MSRKAQESTKGEAAAGGWNEYGPLTRVALRGVETAFRDATSVAREWRALGYPSAPDLDAARKEYADFAALLAEAGAEIAWLPEAAGLTLDSLYLRDAAIVTPRGAILCRMGKDARRGEPAATGAALQDLGLPVLGAIEGAGRLEGGDFLWLDHDLAVVGQGYRTNAEGIEQLRALLGERIRFVVVPLPHYRGAGDVFHLMSMISPLDRDLALVYSPLLPVPFRQTLLERGMTLVEVPDEEFETMGCNVLAVAPRRVIALAGNPVTRQRLETAGCEVQSYRGREISQKGAGGPTCLTRPLVRG